jgi:hypothetical protein
MKAINDVGGRIEKEDGHCTLWLPDGLPEAKRRVLEADAKRWLDVVCADFMTEGEAEAFWASL